MRREGVTHTVGPNPRGSHRLKNALQHPGTCRWLTPVPVQNPRMTAFSSNETALLEHPPRPATTRDLVT